MIDATHRRKTRKNDEARAKKHLLIDTKKVSLEQQESNKIFRSKIQNLRAVQTL